MTASCQRLTVRAGDARVAMAAEGVVEVIRGPRITRMPHGPPGLLGVTHLRGRVLPVVSLSSLLGGEVAAVDRVIVLRREPPLALAVEGIEAVKTVDGAGAPEDGRLLLDDADGARWFDLGAALDARFATFRSAARSESAERTDSSKVGSLVHEYAYLRFNLAGQPYALPIESVLDVSAVPAEVSSLPRTDELLLGVSERRGTVLPIVSLRGLLGLPRRVEQNKDRLVVTRVGGHELGLVVDEVSAILRAPEDRLGPASSLFNRGQGEARIDSVLRLADGKGLVSVLAPEKLLADDRVARLLGSAAGSKEIKMATPVGDARRERFVVLRLGEERYGLPIAAVDEVVRLPETLSRLPRAPTYVRGVMNLRGKVVPVIDQRLRFSVTSPSTGAGRVVVVTIGALQAGFAVDGVDSILEVDTADLLPAPDLTDEGGRVFDQAVERDGEVVLLIDPKALLDRAEADLLSDLTAKSIAS
ncbi:chemotaxis protein CheW [Caulobacter endophyticus]|uniref:Chemotaxis protein CheW n=1 Tax=Caulobacter endophyticus TaxID=2172652 RepID=A0A2T9JGY4_9CAUL|nr:chemotaxis protein CheW [Caulobacter endophyticus]PVM82935.1 chemotaxis protein CheW [Caulobacter endophyticus]